MVEKNKKQENQEETLMDMLRTCETSCITVIKAQDQTLELQDSNMLPWATMLPLVGYPLYHK